MRCYFWVVSVRRNSHRNEGIEASTVQEELPCLRMGCDALKEREGIAHAVRYMRCEVWRGKHWIHGHNFLEKSWHDT